MKHLQHQTNNAAQMLVGLGEELARENFNLAQVWKYLKRVNELVSEVENEVLDYEIAKKNRKFNEAYDRTMTALEIAIKANQVAIEELKNAH
jgi:hypothetical protein